MQFLLPLASLLGIEVEAVTDRLKRTIILNAVMAALGLIGLIFLVGAGFLALAAQMGAIYAALVCAGVFLALALVVYLASQVGEARRRREAAERRRSNETGAFVTTAALTALPVLLKSPLLRTFGLPAAAVAAFLLVRGASDRDEP